MVVVSVFLLGLSHLSGITRIFSQGATSLATPVWRAEAYLGELGNDVAMAVRSKESLIAENKALREELASVKIGLLSRDLLLNENRELKERLGRYDSNPAGLLAAVLVKPRRSPYDTLVIDVGSRHGVDVGDLVGAHGDLLIGTIERAMETTSLVRLFSSPGEEIEVTVGSSNIAALAVGAGGGNFRLEIPRGVDITEGDIISFPSISTTIAGVVERIQVEPNDPFQTILFKSPINTNELKWVEVIDHTERDLQGIVDEETRDDAIEGEDVVTDEQ